MSVHRIQLRKAWTGRFEAGERRVDLPIVWGESEIPSRLRRGFQSPNIDPSRESVRLEISAVPGVIAMSLDGRKFEKVDANRELWRMHVAPEGRSARELILELDPAAVPRDREWGRVALVIGPL